MESTQRSCPSCGKSLPPDVALGLCPECLIKSGFLTGPESNPATPERADEPSLEQLTGLFPQLEILEMIGRGGMGAVYKARQPRLNRFVALKILARGKAGDTSFAERFEREARALAQMNHPNVVTVYDFGETGGLFYLLMEYIDGLNLRQLQHARRITPEEALVIVPPICEALQYAHGRGIVHRDIKPENILLDKEGRVKIADFGIARILGQEATAQAITGDRQILGTPHYMAPEQIEKPATVDRRADIYSLGVVFYELLTGELPLGRFEPPSHKVQVDVRLDEVVLRALEKQPERRYQQAGEIKTQLETIATSVVKSASAEGTKDGVPEAPGTPVARETADDDSRAGGKAPGWDGGGRMKPGRLTGVGVVLALVTIVAILAGIVVPNFLEEQMRSKASREKHARMVEDDFGRKVAHIGGNSRSVLVHQEWSKLCYALFYNGEFTSDVRDSRNTDSLAWVEEGSLTLKNGRTFSYQCRSVDPVHLRINGREFDLRKGKVFVLHDDGLADQLELFPSVAVAGNGDELAKLVGAAGESGTAGTEGTEAEVDDDTSAIAHLKLEHASQELARKKAMFDTGRLPESEYEQARFARDLAAAELTGDPAKVTSVTLQYAESALGRVERRHRVGVATSSELEEAKYERDKAAILYKQATGSAAEVSR